jgi:oxygen-independent coproporphyrinogen III oxidase
MPKQPFGIYIHVPFCKQACSYCDFYFVTREELKAAYVDALCLQIMSELPDFAVNRVLKSIYFGGGTPSRLRSVDIERILETIARYCPMSDVSEITLEANPDDVNKVMLRDLKSIGVTRLSMGVQSFDPELLAFMNRAHSAEEAIHCLELIRQIDFPSFTVDLIYGNPGQSDESLITDIQKLLRFKPPHVSAYALTIEPGTRLGKAAELGRLTPTDDEIVSRHMSIVDQMLDENGIFRYEVSNFARPGHEAVHNGNYWKHVPYIGFGPGAHSLDLRVGDDGKIESGKRWEVVKDIKQYGEKREGIREKRELQGAGSREQRAVTREQKNGRTGEREHNGLKVNFEELSLVQLAEERLLMGLRTAEGVSLEEMTSKYEYELSADQVKWIEGQSGMMIEENNEGKSGNGSHSKVLKIGRSSLALADYLILELISRK